MRFKVSIFGFNNVVLPTLSPRIYYMLFRLLRPLQRDYPHFCVENRLQCFRQLRPNWPDPANIDHPHRIGRTDHLRLVQSSERGHVFHSCRGLSAVISTWWMYCCQPAWSKYPIIPSSVAPLSSASVSPRKLD